MKTALNREPVAVRHPDTGTYITVRRGDEFNDDDPMTTGSHAWMFDEETANPTPGARESTPVVEDASARPGSLRRGPRR